MTTSSRLNKLKQAIAHRQSGLTMVLEDIYDPHNAEAVFRTCDAFGIQTVHLVFDRQPEFDPHRLGKQSSASAHKWLDFIIHSSTKSAIGTLQQQQYTQVATVLDPTTTSIYQTDLTKSKLAIWLGNEHYGLSQTALDLLPHRLHLPMRGLVQSLNLSVTAAICLFEATRQRSQTGRDYSLSLAQKQQLLQSFLCR